jgi:hypothetical protein
VDRLIADPAGSAWSFGGSILTFAFPMILFIVVAATLYVLYTKPEFVPGHPMGTPERPVSYTALPGKPTAEVQAEAAPATVTAGTSAGETSTAATSTGATSAGETSADEAARTEDSE